jgi:hypothetical protein
MFTRALRPFRSHRGKRLGAAALALGLIAAPLVVLPSAASALDPGEPEIVVEDGKGCNGVLPTPGSENTTKRLDPLFPSNFNPGGIVGYVIDYPVDPSDVSGRETFVITDCVFVDGDAVAEYSVSFVPNTAEFQLRFSVPIPAGTALGAQFCNYAKTTAAPSESQASNRKAGPACFTVGGGLRIEKRSASNTGPLLPGASFTVVCDPAVTLPPTIITGLNPSQINQDGTVTAGGVAADGIIAINGPSGTPCVVTETAAPAGYQFDPEPKNLVIPIGQSQTIYKFVNLQLGSLEVTKDVVGGAGESFGFSVSCAGFDLNGDADGTAVTFSLADNGSELFDDIPVGTNCSVTETDPDGSKWTTAYVVNAGTSVSGLTASNVGVTTDGSVVAFTNSRRKAALRVTKNVVGGAGESFTFSVSCPGMDLNGDAVGTTASFMLADNGEEMFSNIPVGTTCSVAETDPDGSKWTTTHSVNGGSPVSGLSASSVGIGVNGSVVAFTNSRRTAALHVTKDVVGGAGESFTFSVSCGGLDLNGDAAGTAASFTLGNNGDKGFSNIPVGTTCSVSETDPDASKWTTTHVVDGGTPVPGLSVSNVAIGLGGNLVAFTNTRRTAGLRVTKDVTGGADESFGFTVACVGIDLTDGPGTALSFSLTDDASMLIPSLPIGSACSVSETDPGASLWATSHSVDGGNSTPGLSASGVTIALGGNLVAFTNTRKTGNLVVTKTANQPGTFVFDIDCSDGSAHDGTGVQIGSGGQHQITGIPTETTCTVTERTHPWFTQTSVVPPNGQISIGTGVNTVAFVNTAKDNGISIDKKVNGTDTSAEEPLDVEVGSTLTYTIKVTNSGLVPLSVSALADTLKSDVAGTCVPSLATSLDPGESVTCTYTMSAADPGGASIIHNTATATGTDIFGRTAGPLSDDTYVHVLNPAIHLEKTGPASAHVGDTIAYTLTVTNPGNTPLLVSDWEDDLCGAEPVLQSKQGSDEWLDPGETWVYTCSRVVVAGDPDRLVNTATVIGTDKLEKDVDDTDDAVTNILRPAIAITKTGTTNAHVGDAVVYTLVVTNSGNTPLSAVTVSDPKCDGPAIRATVDSDGLLSPGEAWTYNCTHVVLASDGASILNTARATGTDPLGQTVDSTDDHTAVVLHPAISIVKTATPDSIGVSGSVTFTYVVTNTGDTVLNNVLVTDDILGAIGTVGQLAVGQSVTFAKTVDVDATTPPRNIGTAVGTDPLGQTVSASDDAVITVVLGAVLAQPELPRTGAPLAAQTWAALGLIQIGLVLTLAGRRRWDGRRAD